MSVKAFNITMGSTREACLGLRDRKATRDVQEPPGWGVTQGAGNGARIASGWLSQGGVAPRHANERLRES